MAQIATAVSMAPTKATTSAIAEAATTKWHQQQRQCMSNCAFVALRCIATAIWCTELCGLSLDIRIFIWLSSPVVSSLLYAIHCPTLPSHSACMSERAVCCTVLCETSLDVIEYHSFMQVLLYWVKFLCFCCNGFLMKRICNARWGI